MLPPHLLEWEQLRSEGEKRSNLQRLRREVQEQIREKREQEEEKKTAVKHARHPKYGEGILVSEDEMMVEVEFAGYGRKQFLKAFGEVTIEA